ncbi:DUF1800 domain-containing protein [Pseudaestuariivita rosea]|uniref:DUF1800 domain-containing protein n=1 Tax=Pseudaestuariivita rosea TaxID=2763263 RepID=UPI001ABA4B1E|nr:DUF1800 domain-containing protein [Pseudaestuariivita rosea]
MQFDPILANARFGLGPSPRHDLPLGAGDLLTEITAPDHQAKAFPIRTFSSFRQDLLVLSDLHKQQRQSDDPQEQEKLRETIRDRRKQLEAQQIAAFRATLSRAVASRFGFRERLMLFWSDHFTAHAKNGVSRSLTAGYVEEAIRPHINGHFADMLKAAVTHPVMLDYLDQNFSAGPNSDAAVKHGRGLNENLAREVIELHTLGVGGAYRQKDVREFARVLAGLRYKHEDGMKFRRYLREPGAKTVLGQRYETPSLQDVHAALEDLARHPDTAHHIARKLAVHFVSDTPDDDLVGHISQAFRKSGGHLPTVYAALLDHPGASGLQPGNIKTPIEFVMSSMRALGATPGHVAELTERQIRQYLSVPLTVMGQRWEQPLGPDGWPEEDDHWITPQGLAARIEWAMMVSYQLRGDLPDPRDFLTDALGPDASGAVRFAATNAETRWEGIGLVLASPAFQRR